MPSSTQRPRNRNALQPTLRFQVVGGAIWIVALTTAVSFPSLIGGFLFDDNLLLTENPLIKAPDGMLRFWYTTEQADYVPLTLTTLWLEWRVWGMNPSGYHVSNLALHLVACQLLWIVLQQLSIPGAFLAALLYVLHPVHVQSVAWIEQRKDLLAILFFLRSIYMYLRSEGQGATDERREKTEEENRRNGEKEICWTAGSSVWYWLSLLAFPLAMCSKGSAVFLPLVLLLVACWQRGRIQRRDLLRSAPFFVVAAVFTPVVIWFVGHGSGAVVRNADFTQRLLGAGAPFGFTFPKHCCRCV